MNRMAVIFIILMVSASVIQAEDAAAPVTPAATAPAVIAAPANDRKLSVSYSSGININSGVNTSGTGLSVRFWPSENMGIEVPLTGSYASFSSDTEQDFTWSAAAGVNFLFPMTQNGSAVDFYFEPGLMLGLKSTLNRFTNQDVFYAYNEEDDYSYAFTGIITAGLEAEVFLNKLFDKFPANISIGGKLSLNGGLALNESWNGYHYPGYTVTNNFGRTYNGGVNFTVLGNTLTGVNIRYYF